MSSAFPYFSAPALMTGTDGHKPDSSGDQGKAPGGNPFKGLGTAYLMAGSLVVGVVLGLAIDRWLGSAPVGLIITSILFIIVGFYHAIRSNK